MRKKYTFDEIRKNGMLLYECYRGSYTQGTYIEGVSDKDTFGVYLEPVDQILGLGLDFQDEIASETHDDTWYSLKKYCTLLLSSNPTMLESLFVDDKYVIYEHPIITDLKKHRNEFLTKKCFNAYIGYAIQQINRASGYNRKCNWQNVERKMPIDFCYTPYRQGSQHISDWLSERGLKQEYCGLVSINNMPDTYGVYYDFGNHFVNENVTEEGLKDTPLGNYLMECVYGPDNCFTDWSVIYSWIKNSKPIGYRGIMKGSGADSIRCSSVENKEALPVCIMEYNKDGFVNHCKMFREYNEWIEKRNKTRYESNLGYSYDSKNMAHCMRLLNMGIEIAETGKMNVDRTGIDADILIAIRNHKYSYETLVGMANEKTEKLKELKEKCNLPDEIDEGFVNTFLINVRKRYQI